MNQSTRMSPLTALFIGLALLGAVVVGAGVTVILYGMTIVDRKASTLLAFANETIDGLPELLEALPPALGEMLNDRRAPEYTAKIDARARFAMDEGTGYLRPVITVKNEGTEVVSLLALRIAALDRDGEPVADWTEVVATPLALDNDWRGPLMPGATRHVVLRGGRALSGKAEALAPAIEIGDIRVWEGRREPVAALSE